MLARLDQRKFVVNPIDKLVLSEELAERTVLALEDELQLAGTLAIDAGMHLLRGEHATAFTVKKGTMVKGPRSLHSVKGNRMYESYNNPRDAPEDPNILAIHRNGDVIFGSPTRALVQA